jgi:probable F420-dependent oxidoreductase
MMPIRFSLQVASATTGAEWRARARRIEELGFSTMYIPDHFGDQWGPIVGMTVAAEATTTLRVGSLVLDNDYRHPVVIAKELAALDLASEGRLEVGIGAGWMKSDYDESGMPYDRPGVRIERMVEGLEIMKQLWRDGTATFEGKHYTVTAAQGLPRPHSTPYPKIVIGGGGQKVLSIAAREADIIGVNPSLRAGYVGPEVAETAKPANFHQRIQWIREAAGDRFDDIELQVLTFFNQITDDRQTVVENMAALFNLTPEETGDVPIALVGTVEEIVDQIVSRRETYGFSYIVIHEAEMEAFAPIVAKLAGT